MNPANDLAAFYALAADLNERLNRLNSNIKRYEEMTPFDLISADSPNPPKPAIDDMSGDDFENWCCQLLRKKGYVDVRATRASGDYGADIIAEKEGVRFAIQCKRYSEPVGIKAVQEAYSAKAHYACDVAAVMTSSSFTEAARKLASECRVKLWGRTVIESWVKSL